MRRDQALDRELQFHLDERVDELVAAGVPVDEARRQARMELGGLLQVKEAVRDQSPWRMLDGWERDLRLALRGLARAPVFTLAAALILGLGIGLNATVFSIVNTVMLRPLPFEHPEDIVRVRRRVPAGSSISFAMADYLALTSGVPAGGAVAALAILDVLESSRSTLLVDGAAEPIAAVRVSARFFEVLGLHAVHGRLLQPGDDEAGRPPVAVITHGLWERRFGGAPGMVGRDVIVGGRPYTLVGIVPDAVAAFSGADCFVALTVPAASQDRANAFQVLARVAPGAGVARAQAELDPIATRHAREHPDITNMPQGVVLRALQDDMAGPVRAALRMLTVAVLLVLLVACSNVANIVLARGLARRREMALMTALGASQWRIVRAVLVENLVVAALGGALGLLLAYGAVRVLPAVSPMTALQADRIHVDAWVLLFVAAAAGLSAVLASLPLAFQLSGIDLMHWIRQGSAQGDAGIDGGRLRGVLASLQVALSALLLIGAGLLIRSFWNLTAVDPGFQADHVMTMTVALAPSRYGDSASLGRYTSAVSERLERIPGVLAASSTTALPFQFPVDFPVSVAGPRQDTPAAGQGPELLDAWYRAIDPGFFSAMSIPLVSGRAFDASDTPAGAPVVIVSQGLARRAFPDGEAIGRSLIVGEGFLRDARDLRPRTIVGIAGDTREESLRQGVTMTLYLPVGQAPEAITKLVVAQLPPQWVIRTSGPPERVVAAAREAVRAIDPTQPASDFATLATVLARSIAPHRFNMLMLTAFGGLALALAAIGVYGLMAYAVVQRTREIGIRLSLGARPGRLVREIVWRGLRVCLAGAAIGVAASLWLGRGLRTLLFGVQPIDLPTIALVVAVLITTVVVAIYLPASRAAAIDPVMALRHD